MQEKQTLELKLEKELYDSLLQRAIDSGFASIEDYTTFILKEVLKEDDVEMAQAEELTPEQEEEIRQHLKGLGYLE